MSKQRRRIVGAALLAALLALFVISQAWDVRPGYEDRGAGAAADDPSEVPEHATASSRTRRRVGDDTVAAADAPAHTLIVRDLADGRPVDAGVRVRVQLADGATHMVATDTAGRVTWTAPSSEVVAVIAASAEDTVVFDPHLMEERSEVWWLRRCQVRGRVVFEGLAEDATQPLARVHTAFTGDGVPGASTSVPPWEPGWLARHGVNAPQAIDCGADGAYVIELPRIRGVTLTAVAPGYRPSDWTVLVAEPHTTFEHDFVLGRSYRLRGTVTDESGAPVAGAFVSVYVTTSSSMEAVDRERLRAQYPSGAVTTAFLGARNEALVTVRDTVVTDESGSFDLPVRGRGAGFLNVVVDGLAPAVQELGAVDSDRDALRVQLGRPRHGISRVELRVDGEPVRQHEVVVSDVTREGAQPAIDVETDAAGTIPAYMLIPGRSYLFTVFKSLATPGGTDAQSFMGRMGMLRWSGETVIDLAELTTNRDELR